MVNKEVRKHFDLEERTLKFAKDARKFIRQISRDLIHAEDAKQLVRSSGSIGANYIEANEALGKKDFLFRLKIAKKEAKESRYWLTLLQTEKNPELRQNQKDLYQEATELMNIFGAIIRKIEKPF